MDVQKFFDTIRPIFPRGRMSAEQVQRVEVLLDAASGLPRRWIAYILATAFHESDCFKTMHEYGKGRGKPYGVPVKIYSKQTRVYYGRGYVQLTWLSNYGRFSAVTGLDLVNNPDLATDPKTAARICVEGMTGGLFTGVSLGSYTKNGRLDYVNARRVVNGMDRAEDIAHHAETFERALNAAAETTTAQAATTDNQTA